MAGPQSLPPQELYLVWTYQEPHPGISFEIWSSTNLIDWRCYALVSDPPVLIGGEPIEFFRIRAVDEATGLVSDWAHQ